MANFIVQADLVERWWLRIALTTRSILDPRNIFMGQYSMHAGQFTRLAGINTDNTGVGMRAGEQFTVEHAIQPDIVGIHRPATDQLHRVDFYLRLADNLCLLHINRGED